MSHLLDPGFNLTLRPMRYPKFYEMYRAAIKNTWSVEEIDFQIDLGHMQRRMSPADRHLIERLVAFFATGDSIVANNLVLSLYKHINAPEARMYLSRQLFEEALHVQFYLTLLDNYIPDQAQRARAFADDVLSEGVAGLTRTEMRQYLQYVADQRMLKLKLPVIYGSRNPFAFMELQDVQELTNFFERSVSAYQVAVQGEVAFDHAF